MALKTTRKENYPQWYQCVVSAADMAENSVSPGCMVMKAWGYGLWERLQRVLDEKIKETGHENYYFPMFIPLSFFQKEADHVEGFAKEMAVVTHSRLVNEDGKLKPSSPLEEPLIVRPTSETIIADSFAKWVKSYRDLPILLNQWANVVRWEMRPRLFLRTREFLWQEGHTVHATMKEAEDENKYFKVLKEYVNPRVLILDEWLLNPITNEEARYVLDLIHKRRKKSSTIFCSQYEDTGWYAQLGGDETPLADSIMDRIAYDSYKINIRAKDPTKDRSMREVYGIRPDERE